MLVAAWEPSKFFEGVRIPLAAPKMRLVKLKLILRIIRGKPVLYKVNLNKPKQYKYIEATYECIL